MSYEDVKSPPTLEAKRILVVCGAGYVYGRENVTLSLVDGLNRRGHDVASMTSIWSDGKFEGRLKELSIPCERLPFGFVSKQLSWSAIWMTLDQLRRLPALWVGYRRFKRNFNPDVVLHTNFHHVFLLWPMLRKETNIFHVHDAFAPTPFYRQVFRLLNRRINVFVGISSFIATSLVGLGLPESKIKCVLNGAPLEDCQRCDSDASVPDRNPEPGPIRIGIVGQVEEWKGHEDLIEALRILQSKNEPFRCLIFGTGSSQFTARLKSRIKDYGLTDKVEWMGFVDNKKLIYDAMDVCVTPSRFTEPFGMVAVEAAMHGLPVIASRIGGLPEVVINERTGYLVDAKSPDQIAEKIEAFSISRVSRAEMGKNAKAHVQASLGVERMIAQMEAVIAESLVNGSEHARK
jgi:glycosyltransferase involved in cell wall biosynthesis